MALRFDDPKYDAAFDRCIDVMTALLLKYGPHILEQKEPVEVPVANVPQKENDGTGSMRQIKNAA